MSLRFIKVVAAMTLIAFFHVVNADDARNNLFQPMHAAIDKAHADKVDVLAPKSFERAVDQLQDAEKDFDKGRKPEQVNGKLKNSQQSLLEAQQFATTSHNELTSVISARDDALTAEAPKYAREAWLAADQRFRDAVDRIERKDIEGAHRKGAEAEVLLRDTELSAIKGNLLGDARNLIAQADQMKTADFAPRSLTAAKRYLAQADEEIAHNRYDRAVPTRLVAQAVYEARHAVYLREQIAPLLEKENIKQQGLEQVMLNWEESIRRLAGELDIEPHFDQGYSQPMQDIFDKVEQQQRDMSILRQSVRDRDEQLALLTTEIKQLQAKLGGESQERLELQKRLSTQERLRDNVSKIENMFSAEEGRVFREGNNLTMSLTGINFRVGKSTIEPDAFALLAKVGDAIKLFPDASLVVEGHTDSQGTDSASLLLSQDRADAVRQYLISNLGVSAEKVSAVGYGKSRPVASNDNETGRARNRRIDVVMKIIGD